MVKELFKMLDELMAKTNQKLVEIMSDMTSFIDIIKVRVQMVENKITGVQIVEDELTVVKHVVHSPTFSVKMIPLKIKVPKLESAKRIS